MYASLSLLWTTEALPGWMIYMTSHTVSKQQLIMYLVFLAGYYKFSFSSRPLNLSCSCISQQLAHQTGSINMYGFLTALFQEKCKKKRSKGRGRLFSDHFSAWEGRRKRKKMSSLEISDISHVLCWCFGLTWHIGKKQSFPSVLQVVSNIKIMAWGTDSNAGSVT